MKRLRLIIEHLFVPSENNNYQAKTLHLDFLTYYLILAMFFSFLFKWFPFSKNILGVATDITVQKLFQLTNNERIKNGLKPLSYNEKLAKAAFEKAKDMFAKNYWAHYAPDGKTPWDFILSSGYQYEYAGENLAKDFMFSEGVVSAWMNSKTHRENILRPEYNEIGFAVVNGVLNGEETTLVVQMFGKPLEGKNLLAKKMEKEFITPLPTKSSTIKTILNQTTKPALATEISSKPVINIKKLFFNYTFLIFSLLIIALISDLYFAYQLKVIRISGKHLAHFIFLGFGLMLLISATKGTIL